jgi:HAD superfamily hydrolase (TIGR01484 family)
MSLITNLYISLIHGTIKKYTTSEQYYTTNMKKTKKYKHLFFDLDDTLTRTRSSITQNMKKRLKNLPQTIVVISGASVQQIRKQIGEDIECFVLGQNGNSAMFGKEELWHDVLKPDKVIEIMDHISSLKLDWDVPDKNDLLENRGCQISYSIYGHHAPVEEKEKFDPNQEKRKKLLRDHPLVSDSVEVKIAGTTTLDYTRIGRNKGYHIMRLIEHMKWDKNDCLYFGDSLFEGGNDATVLGVIDTEKVKDHKDTYEKLERFLEK